MSDAARRLATKIMALVDNTPSEPFSLERRWTEANIYELIVRHSEEVDGELDEAYNIGYSEGHSAGYDEAEDESSDRIAELEEELEELRSDLEDFDARIDQAFAEGYQTASQGDRIIETLQFKN
jgi:flagellar biosynthesis/type III secretory pathway protein FliH